MKMKMKKKDKKEMKMMTTIIPVIALRLWF